MTTHANGSIPSTRAPSTRFSPRTSTLGSQSSDAPDRSRSAGRGRYQDDQPGSPLLLYDRAVRAAAAGDVRKVLIRCVERNRSNCLALIEEIEKLGNDQVEIEARQDRFDVVAHELADNLERFSDRKSRPIFVTVDPFGFSGVPLEVIQRLMAHPRVEVLITYMVRDMRRFLSQPQHQVALTEFFGGDSWDRCLQGDDHERCLLLRYAALIKERGIARHTLTFRVFEDEKAQTLYYLIHLTNERKGMLEMKRAMIKTSSDMIFRPVTLAAPLQGAFDVAEQAPYPTLQSHLLQRFSGLTISFQQLIDDDYPGGTWLEGQYKEAIKALEKSSSRVAVDRQGLTRTGRTRTGLDDDDSITFPPSQPALV
jgi:three-Cys-motif partner protein